MRRSPAAIAVALAAAAWWLGSTASIDRARRFLHAQTIDPSLVGVQRVTARLVEGGWLEVRPGRESDSPREVALDPGGRRHSVVYTVNRGDGAAANPAAVALKHLDPIPGLARLSIAADEADLHDPDHGILTHPVERGAPWEREVFFAVADGDGRLLSQGAAGLRVHGGASRQMTLPSLRLHFRPSLGVASFDPRPLLGGSDFRGWKNLVVHNDWRRAIPDESGDRLVLRGQNPLFYELCRRLGVPAPRTYPATVVLNGQPHRNLYFLTERVDRDFVRRRLGHDDFDFGLFRDADADDRPQFYVDLQSDLVHLAAPLRAAEVTRTVALEPFRRLMFLVTFWGSRDCYQGAYYRDRREDSSPLRFVPWDMDRAFTSAATSLEPWQMPILANVGRSRPEGPLQPFLFGRLLAEDRGFARAYIDDVNSFLNHDLDQAYLQGLVERLRQTARTAGVVTGAEDERGFDLYRRFLAERPAFYRQELARLCHVNLVTVHVEAPADQAYLVDGHRRQGAWTGRYRAGAAARIAPVAGARLEVADKIVEAELRIDTSADVTIVLDRTRR